MYGIDWWYCCLTTADKTIIRQTCEGLALTLGIGIPVPVWGAFWIATGKLDPFYKEQFRAIYGLEIATIEGDSGPIDVVRVANSCPFDWAVFGLFILSSHAACLDGCGQSRVP